MSSISSVANGGQNYAPQQLQASIGMLAANLASNNLSGARRAFSGIQQALGSSTNGDLSLLGQALKSGDLAGARKAFTRLGQNRNAAPQTETPAQQPANYSPSLAGSSGALDIAV